MKTLKTILHYWIALVSITGFLGGWVVLAHSAKPVQPSQQTTSLTVQGLQQPQALPTLAPLDMSGNSASASNNNSFFQILTQPQQQQSGFPVLVTKGS
jgi:hypothetical protein